jgi:trimeric autotransporter adhesin
LDFTRILNNLYNHLKSNIMKTLSFCLIIILLNLIPGYLLNAQFQLVANINTSLDNAGSSPECFIKYDGSIYFGAYDLHGPGIWKTDGTETGTELVTHKAAMNEAILYKDNILFIGTDQIYDNGLWLSDGTEDGTVLLHNFNIWTGPIIKPQLTPFGDKVAFRFYNEKVEYGLWITDGTKEGTRILKDPELRDASPENLTVFNDKLLFIADDATPGRALWISDGSSEGTEIIKDLSLSVYPEPYGFKEYNDRIYFIAKNDTCLGLFSTDGTDTGTDMTSALPDKLRPYHYGTKHLPEITIFNDTLYFALYYPDHPVFSLWKVAGDSVVKVHEFEQSVDWIIGLHSLPGKLIIMIANPLVEGTKDLYLWSMDLGGLQNYFDIKYTYYGTYDFETVVDDSVIYFNYGNMLWKTDGKQEGTSQITRDCYLPPSSNTRLIYLFDGTLFFRGYVDSIRSEPWISDGTADGTILIKDINRSIEFNGIDDPISAGDKLYFNGYVPQYGNELWVSDGTPSGTVMLKDIFPGEGFSEPSGFIELNGNLYFTASESHTGLYIGVIFPSGLWKTDGSESGTVKIKNIATRFASSIFPATECPDKVRLGDKILFTAAIPLILDTCDIELWESDGTTDGTRLLKNIDPGVDMANVFGKPNLYTLAGDIVFFAATTRETGTELWKTDGTTEGTIMVSDLCSGPASSLSYDPGISNFTGFDNSLIFTPFDSVYGYELWISDGSKQGTHLIRDINPGTGNTEVISPLTVNDNMFFGTDDGIHGTELWKTDGTESGTSLVKDIHPSGSGFMRSIGEFNGTYFFLADDSIHGLELWKSDGTSEGTSLFLDANPGESSGGVGSFISIENKFFYTASDENWAYSLWISDGTPEGTEKAGNWPSSKIGSTGKFVLLNNSIYFTAIHEDYGEALFRYDLSGLSVKDTYESSFIVYPNPVLDELHIKTGQLSGNILNIRIMDMTGKIISHYRLKNAKGENIKLNTGNLEPGIYLLVIDANSDFNVNKFIKQ